MQSNLCHTYVTLGRWTKPRLRLRHADAQRRSSLYSQRHLRDRVPATRQSSDGSRSKNIGHKKTDLRMTLWLSRLPRSRTPGSLQRRSRPTNARSRHDTRRRERPRGGYRAMFGRGRRWRKSGRGGNYSCGPGDRAKCKRRRPSRNSPSASAAKAPKGARLADEMAKRYPEDTDCSNRVRIPPNSARRCARRGTNHASCVDALAPASRYELRDVGPRSLTRICVRAWPTLVSSKDQQRRRSSKNHGSHRSSGERLRRVGRAPGPGSCSRPFRRQRGRSAPHMRIFSRWKDTDRHAHFSASRSQYANMK